MPDTLAPRIADPRGGRSSRRAAWQSLPQEAGDVATAGFHRRAGYVITIYMTPWCGYCVRLKRQLDRVGLAYVATDIETDPTAEQLVRDANNGDATVPTVRFPDGTLMTNPSLRQVMEKVASAA
jgi:mycoredoxin